MSLKLLIDEDSQAQSLVNLLRNASHDVLTVNEAGLMSQPDSIVLNYAIENNRVLLTRNCRDFKALHEVNSSHPGILAIYQEANPLKKISYKDLVKAIANLESANFSLANQFIALNHWNY